MALEEPGKKGMKVLKNILFLAGKWLIFLLFVPVILVIVTLRAIRENFLSPHRKTHQK